MKNQKGMSAPYTDQTLVIDGEYGKIPPQDVKVEEAVIGTLLVFPDAVEKVAHLLENRMFYRQANGVIYNTVISLYNSKEPVDLLTVTNALRSAGKLEETGGAAYLMKVSAPVNSDFYIESHAAVIFDKFIRREIIRISAGAMKMSFTGELGIDGMLQKLERQMSDIGEMVAGKKKSRDSREILDDCIAEAWQWHENWHKGKSNGIPTGFCDLDKILNGWQNSDFIVLAARPSMGKTAIALKFARAAAASGTPVTLFSLEMKDTQLFHRMILSGTDVDARRYRAGNTSTEDMQKVEASAGNIYNFPISTDDNSGVSMSYISAQAKILKKQDKCGLILIDYLQLVREEANAERNREQAMAAISSACKSLAKELDVPVIALSQLNRECEKRQDKKPLLADLRDSGAIEQDADVVIFVHRPEKFGKVAHDTEGRIIEHYGELIVSKNRQGEIGDVKFTHNGSMTEFYDYDRYGYGNYGVF
jgi:replicative DNA helicase